MIETIAEILHAARFALTTVVAASKTDVPLPLRAQARNGAMKPGHYVQASMLYRGQVEIHVTEVES